MIIFNSSMPRSGSTLLQNILAQNPNITSSPTSFLGELVAGAVEQVRNSVTVKAEGYDNVIPKFKEFIKDGIEAWGNISKSNSNANIYIDKSRSWLFQKKLLHDIYGNDFKILCMVRDLKGIISSMEKNHSKNVYRSDHIEGSGAVTLFQRIEGYFNSVPINPFLNKLVDLIQCNDTTNIIFIRYEALIDNPQAIMSRIYKELGLPDYIHDFNNIEQITHEDDEFHGIYGQHKIKSRIINPNSDNYFDKDTNTLIDNTYPFFQSYFGYIQ